MKIIAKGGGDSGHQQMYIVEVTFGELMHIAGGYEFLEAKNRPVIDVGTKIEVHDIFHRIANIDKNRGKILEIQTQLRGIASLLDPIESVVNELCTMKPAKGDTK